MEWRGTKSSFMDMLTFLLDIQMKKSHRKLFADLIMSTVLTYGAQVGQG